MSKEQNTLEQVQRIHDTLVSYLVIIANALLISCGGAMAAFPQIALTPWPYFGFTIGHAMWLLIGIIWERSGLIVLNVVFILLDTYGLYVRLFGG